MSDDLLVLPPLGDWLEEAACSDLGAEGDIFTADKPTPDELAVAESICWRCPVRQECAAYAESAPVYGMWAGVWRSLRHRSREEIAA